MLFWMKNLELCIVDAIQIGRSGSDGGFKGAFLEWGLESGSFDDLEEGLGAAQITDA